MSKCRSVKHQEISTSTRKIGVYGGGGLKNPKYKPLLSARYLTFKAIKEWE